MIDRREFIAMLTGAATELTQKSRDPQSQEIESSSLQAHPRVTRNSEKQHDLESHALRVQLSLAGSLERIENLETKEAYVFSGDKFSITTNKGTFSNQGLSPDKKRQENGVVSYLFSNKGQYNVALNYRIGSSGHYVERWLDLEDAAMPLELVKIDFSWGSIDRPPDQVIKYDTFWNTPTVVFLRWHRGGLFTGVENPFFSANTQCAGLSLSYDPLLLLGAGDAYSSEPQFIGVFSRNGKTLTDHYLPTLVRERPHMMRFRNPSGHIPLDWNEIQSVRQFVYDYLNPRLNRFLCSLYMYWYPIEQLWPLAGENQEREASIEAKYKRIVENFSVIGGDLIIFNPLFNYTKAAGGSEGYWNVAPGESAAGRIIGFAQEKGIDCGFYMGVAAHGDEGNACALPFVPEEQAWKKVDFSGARGGENCIACRGFADWWYEVQKNTILKFNLRYWSWDPGPGNGSFCYSADHGHIPGKGVYKGWLEATRLTGRLKSEFPELLLMAFYGRKEYGLWGLKNFDLHESYWEQTILYGATKHPDLHDDRMNADGARFQSWWNENFRFLPTAMNHALVHRIGENNYDSRLPKVWDHLGWRYALMSAIATSGSVFPCILPEDMSNVADFVPFYRKWLEWARKNIEYVRYNVSFGDQVRPGGVDVHARIKEDHGFIFLCNPGPRPARTEFELGRSIGLKLQGSFTLRELHPGDDRFYFDDRHHRGIYQTGDSISITVPAYEVCLFEMSRFNPSDLPLVFGVGGKIQRIQDGAEIEGVTAQPGEFAEVVILPNGNRSEPTLTINKKPIKLARNGQYWQASLRFAGKVHPRALDDWWTTDGKKFSFPFNGEWRDLHLRTRIFVDPSIQAILGRAVPPNLSEFRELLDSWRESLPFTFAWARPDRLWFALPFVEPNDVGDITMRCNGKDVAVQWFAPRNRPNGSRIIAYTDITDTILFGSENEIDLHLRDLQENQFLGPFLDYPIDAPVDDWEPLSAPQAAKLVYDRAIDPEMPERVATISHAAPRVLGVELDPPFIRPRGRQKIIAEVSIAAEQLQNVWVSVGPAGEAAMSWDDRQGKWTYEWTAPTRAEDILDAEHAYVWAVTKVGILSESFKIAMRWMFTES